mmetsp:Transcript_1494/g.2475  ORF Transcript_1494/g.2475 Transcript_1494/m.2475 type:complete len:86 (+) Transcript_1494:117-374(+)
MDDDEHVEDVEDFLNSYAPEHGVHEQAQAHPIVITDEEPGDNHPHAEFEGIYQDENEEHEVHIIESGSEIQDHGQGEMNEGEGEM